MRVIGLTGGIAMGKSTAVGILRYCGLPVHDADSVVHALYSKGGAGVSAVAREFPDAIVNGAVDRVKLRESVIGKPQALSVLESIIHPLVRQHSAIWMRSQQLKRFSLVILDVPLLFETGRDREMDEIWVVNCSALIQRQRVLARHGMDVAKLEAILARQTQQSYRLRFADRIFQTGNGKAALFRALKVALSKQTLAESSIRS